MKIISITFFCLLFHSNLFSQIIISPYVAFVDNKNKSTTLLITNSTYETQEVNISLKFGYPVTDTLGNVLMEYPDSSNKRKDDITKYVKYFPKKFMLEPGEQQTVRLTIKAPVDLSSGTYWTRIVTTTKPKNQTNNISTSPFANINLVLSQVTTLLYKNKKFENILEIIPTNHNIEHDKLNLFIGYKVKGDSPFFADNKIVIYDDKNNAVKEKQEYFTVYWEMNRKNSIDIAGLAPGDYCAEIICKNNLSDDIPVSDKPLKDPVIRKIYFTIK